MTWAAPLTSKNAPDIERAVLRTLAHTGLSVAVHCDGKVIPKDARTTLNTMGVDVREGNPTTATARRRSSLDLELLSDVSGGDGDDELLSRSFDAFWLCGCTICFGFARAFAFVFAPLGVCSFVPVCFLGSA